MLYQLTKKDAVSSSNFAAKLIRPPPSTNIFVLRKLAAHNCEGRKVNPFGDKDTTDTYIGMSIVT